MKKAFLFFSTVLLAFTGAYAQQPCGTDEIYRQQKLRNPQIAAIEAQLEQEIQQRIMSGGLARFAKGTGVADSTYHIPLVFHVIHDYGSEYVTDNDIFAVVKDMNQLHTGTNPDTAGLLPAYAGNIPGTNIQYRAKSNIVFHLATKDPQGNPTHGITRHRSYQAFTAGDNAKLDLWPSDSYINIWLVRTFGPGHVGAGGYAYYPQGSNPYIDGVITIQFNYEHTIAHEIGHVLNLQHVFGNTNNPGVSCGDDNVDDTPPTKGHLATGCSPSAIYDNTCAVGYAKTYTPTQSMALFGDLTHTYINYPDTVNSQNVMDYTFCAKMFTYLQGLRMRAALESPVAGRSNLHTPQNLALTGALDPWPDLPPVADFNTDKVFLCANGQTPINFINRSWNDTLSAASWTFSNGANPATSNSLTGVTTAFSQAGWVNATLQATSNAGSNSITKQVYATDPTAISPGGYYQEFNAGGDLDRYPIFNYFGSDHKWEVMNSTGYYDNSSIRYTNFDSRTGANYTNNTQSPGGNYADFFTRGFDLSGATPTTNLNFMYAGAYRTYASAEMNDTLEIAYSSNCGSNWFYLGRLTGAQVGNNGYVNTFFAPGSTADWQGYALNLPSPARTSRVYFRFRFKTGSDNSYFPFGTGNNFYIDRLNITNNPLGVSAQEFENNGMLLAPNPTSGSATLTLKGGDNSLAQVSVTDITGKVVYRAEARLSGAVNKIDLPAIGVKGMYLVHVVANGKAQTQKLVVN